MAYGRPGWLCMLLGAVLLCRSLDALGRELSPRESRGKQIFTEGKSASGATVNARVGMMSQRVPASVVPCANCHGQDGRGRSAAGIARPEITWGHLTMPHGHRHASGRSHPAFTEDTFNRAITAGIDPAGNRLDPAMPRYELGEADIEDLIAYLKRIGPDG